MEPYYKDEYVAIYNADCRTILESMDKNTVDVTVTSPPYNTLRVVKGSGMNKRPNNRDNKWLEKVRNHGYSDALDESVYQTWLAHVVALSLFVSNGLVWINHKVRYRDKKAVHPCRFLPFDLYSEVIWNRSGSMALNCKRYAPSHETLLGFGKPHYWNDEFNKKLSVWKVTPTRNKPDHPCPFPESLIEPLILSSCPEGGIVLDPFLGSGTTALVCKRLKRHCIGIEKNERYCELASSSMRDTAE